MSGLNGNPGKVVYPKGYREFESPPLRMKKVIFFDFDGVIADSFHIGFEVAKLTYPSLTLESYRDKWNTNISKAVFTETKSETPVDFQKEFATRLSSLELAPAKKKALHALSEHFDFHIISSTNTDTIGAFCAANGIDQYFGDILGYDVAASKVHKFASLLQKYQLDPTDIIFITDTAGDIDEARESKIGTIIAVADGYQNKEVLAQANPTYIADSLVEVPSILTQGCDLSS